jgi:hypothetical protein
MANSKAISVGQPVAEETPAYPHTVPVKLFHDPSGRLSGVEAVAAGSVHSLGSLQNQHPSIGTAAIRAPSMGRILLSTPYSAASAIGNRHLNSFERSITWALAANPEGR